MEYLVTILSFVIVIGVLVTFHELGHFLVARFFDVGVEKFSVGFGKPLYTKKIGYTEYIIGSIPLGGYVKMTGEQESDEVEVELSHLSFQSKKLYQRALIVAAGPLFNFVLAILIYFLIFSFSGVPKSVIGEISPGSPAEKAGIMRGDTVLKIDGEDALAWSFMDSIISESEGKPLDFEILRDGIKLNKYVTPVKTESLNVFNEKEMVYNIGVGAYIKPVVGSVIEGYPAFKSGLLPGDKIVSINSVKMFSSSDVSKYIMNNGIKEHTFEIMRGEKNLYFKIAPVKRKVKDQKGKVLKDAKGNDREKILVGIAFESNPPVVNLSFFNSAKESFSNTLFIMKSTVVGIYKMINGSVSSKNIGGPIFIAQIAGKVVKKGLKYYLNFIAVLSINLAILNLIPIPVLDGGHLMFYSIEAVTGKPVNKKAKEIAQNIGMVLLFMLIIFSLFNDIARIVK